MEVSRSITIVRKEIHQVGHEQIGHNKAKPQSSKARIRTEAGGYKIQPAENAPPAPQNKGKIVVAVRKKPTCYETVSSAHHRVQAWLEEETSKYTMFFRHLRIT